MNKQKAEIGGFYSSFFQTSASVVHKSFTISSYLNCSKMNFFVSNYSMLVLDVKLKKQIRFQNPPHILLTNHLDNL